MWVIGFVLKIDCFLPQVNYDGRLSTSKRLYPLASWSVGRPVGQSVRHTLVKTAKNWPNLQIIIALTHVCFTTSGLFLTKQTFFLRLCMAIRYKKDSSPLYK